MATARRWERFGHHVGVLIQLADDLLELKQPLASRALRLGRLKERGTERQLRNEQVTQARRGNVEEVMPGVFSVVNAVNAPVA